MSQIQVVGKPDTMCFQCTSASPMHVIAMERVVLVLQVEDVHTAVDGFQCALTPKSAEAWNTAVRVIPRDPKACEVICAENAKTGEHGTGASKKPQSSKASKSSQAAKPAQGTSGKLAAKLQKGLVKSTIGKMKKQKEEILDPWAYS